MTLSLHKSKIQRLHSFISITGSKSESNRALLLQAFYPNIQIVNLSNSDDSEVMQKALSSKNDIIDIHHAGTAMRFLTAYFATQEGKDIVLTGSSRMKERPIKILVDALISLGADISYLETHGCPPLSIRGKSLTKNHVTLEANVSSQYISALLLIAPKLKNGLQLTLAGNITSLPYINMTLQLLNQLGIATSFKDQVIYVEHTPSVSNKKIVIESDWSSASYFYSIVALSDIKTEIVLSSYDENSKQGDSALVDIYKNFGVETTFETNSIQIKKVKSHEHQTLKLDLNHSPDIAQTIAVTCLGVGVGCKLSGLHTLKIKETDRLVALKNEIEKFGGIVEVTDDSLSLTPSDHLKNNVSIDTYQDHRMAMAFAPLALKTDMQINDADVVSKSFPTFWDDLKSIGFKMTQ